MQSASPSSQLERLQLLLLRKRLAAAEEEHTALKSAVHGEVDAQRESRKAEKLRAKLQQLALNEAALQQRLCYGLPPGWENGGSQASSASASGAEGFKWGSWQEGTEVTYTSRRPATGSPGAQQQLQVTHSTRSVRLQRSSLPFAIGGLRAAFYAQDADGGRFVLKRTLLESSRLEKRVRELHADAEAAALSGAAAAAFSGALHGVTEVSYLAASVVVLDDPACSGGKAVYLKEPWMSSSASGKWVKWSRNDGHMFEEGQSCSTIQAFTHFSLHWLGKQLGCPAIVLDAQGIQAGKRFTLTDPALCTADQRYGKSDLGRDAITTFLAAHTCNGECATCGCTGVGL